MALNGSSYKLAPSQSKASNIAVTQFAPGGWVFWLDNYKHGHDCGLRVTGTRDNGLMGVAAGWLHQKSMGNSNHLSSHAKAVVKSLDTRAYALWSKIWKAAHIADSNFRLPESRTYTRDWVRDGVHIPR